MKYIFNVLKRLGGRTAASAQPPLREQGWTAPAPPPVPPPREPFWDFRRTANNKAADTGRTEPVAAPANTGASDAQNFMAATIIVGLMQETAAAGGDGNSGPAEAVGPSDGAGGCEIRSEAASALRQNQYIETAHPVTKRRAQRTRHFA